jgi:hypothetical protein
MGYELFGHGGASFNSAAWGSSLVVAEAFGWEPTGTIMPDDCEGTWNGSYFSNDLQRVTRQDARELGLALHRAIAAIRAGNALTEEHAKAVAEGFDIRSAEMLGDYALGGEFVIG